jgi:CHAT domain-containing protein/tetratricopeptide (TPR) repeat protein
VHGSLRRALMVVALLALAAGCAPSAAELARLHDEAQVALRQGRLNEAVALAERGASRAEAAEDPVRAWEFRLLGADAHASLLELPAAMTVLEAPVPAEPAFARVRAQQKLLLAHVTVSRGDLKRGGPLVDEVMPLTAGYPELAIQAGLLQAQVLYRTGRAAAADVVLDGLRTLAAQQDDEWWQALVLNTSGMGLVTRSRFDEALAYFRQVIGLSRVEGTSVHAAAMNNAAMMLSRLGQFEQALPLHQRAVAFQKTARRQDYLQALGELGSTHFLKGEVALGMAAWKDALRIAAEAQLADEAGLWARNLAGAAAQEGDWDEAERYNAEASRWRPDATGSRRAFALLTTAQIAAGRGRRDEARRIYGEALAAAADVPAVQWTAHDGLARVAAAEGQPAEAAREFELALTTIERTRSSVLTTDNRISLTSRLIAFYRAYVDFLLTEGLFDRALEVADSSRGRVLAERQGVSSSGPRVTVASLRRLARQTNTTMVFYWLGPEGSWAWTVSAGGIATTPLPPGPEIAGWVTAHQAAIQNALADPLAGTDTPGDALYARVVAPVARTVPRGGSVVIVPDGALHRLNFETLPVPGTPKHYWIEDVVVQMAPSLSMLRPRPPARTAGASVPLSQTARGRSLLLVGNPTPRAPEFPALSYAAAEMDAVTKHFPGGAVTTVAGAEATPDGFRAAHPENFSVIHFTSHAVANIEAPLDSAVILSGPDRSYKLYARDVAALPLTADLVTVSACRSAGERAYAGEGLVGFAWAFLRAGSNRVVAGLWDVDDRSTATLMDTTYAGIAAGRPPAMALRDAKLALMKSGFPRPYYWAPFQMFSVAI